MDNRPPLRYNGCMHYEYVRGQRRAVYEMPRDAAELAATMWTTRVAAKMWDVHQTTAQRWMVAHREWTHAQRIVLRGRRGDRLLWAVPAFTRRVVRHGGNPDFKHSEAQRMHASIRWAKERSYCA